MPRKHSEAPAQGAKVRPPAARELTCAPKPAARDASALESLRGCFASTLKPLRFPALQPPAGRIDSLSKCISLIDLS